MIEVQEHVDIREHTTFKVGGQFRYFIEVSAPEELPEVYNFAKEKNLPVHILGGGSNMVFPDGVFECVVVKIEFCNFELVNETEEYADL